MSRPNLALLIFLAGLMTFAQPGLCPCWLMADVQKYHPHPAGNPQRPHSHDYLSDLAQGDLVPAAPVTLLPAHVLLMALLALAGLWWRLGHRTHLAAAWSPPSLTPPPRPAAS